MLDRGVHLKIIHNCIEMPIILHLLLIVVVYDIENNHFLCIKVVIVFAV